MAQSSSVRQRARQKLDERLTSLKPESRFAVPPKGWIRAIREAIGMTGAQFAARLGVKPPSVVDLEKSEATGSMQLRTLRRAAAALDCQLVYALVPRTSLQQAVDERARRIALAAIERVAHTMALEDQAVNDPDLEARVAAYIREHIKDRDLWSEP
jgi:predicted DNA-binding mobile mystery protein A